MVRSRTGQAASASAALVALAVVGAACSGGGGHRDGGAATTVTRGGPTQTLVRGGTLVYGIEAASAKPWAPYETACAISCYEVEQGQYIGSALAGTFDALAWRNHGGVNADQQFVWWYSGSSAPVGTWALNFGRFQDRALDQARLIERITPDPSARRAAAESINRSFGQHMWNLWMWWDTWGIQTNERLQDVTNLRLPGGAARVAPLISGRHGIAHIRCTGGVCG